MAITNGLNPYPEWRQLRAAIEPLIGTQKKFTYEELSQLAGCDIQSARGRGQFYLFRRHAAKEWRIWFEVVVNEGYEIIPASQHAAAAITRVRQARRKIGVAKSIQEHVRIEDMNDQDVLRHAQISCLVDDLSHTFGTTAKRMAGVASVFKQELSPEALKAIADAGPKAAASKPSNFGAPASADALRAISGPRKPRGT